jgi:hypothetical protein
MQEQDVTDILRRAARIVASAGLADALEPVAFRIVVDTLIQEAKGNYGAIQPSRSGKADLLEGLAINEFLAELAVRSHTDRFVAIAYYLLHSKGQLTFSVRHLQEGYTLAREPKAKNFAAIAGQCASRGFFTETGAKLDDLKEWQITKTGEAHVEQLMSKSAER